MTRRRSLAWSAAALAIAGAGWLVIRDRRGPVAPDAERATGRPSNGPPAPLGAPELAGTGWTPPRTPATDSDDATPTEKAWSPPALSVAVEFVDSETGARVRGCELKAPEAEPGINFTAVPGWKKFRILEKGMENAYALGLSRRGIIVPDGYVVVARTPLFRRDIAYRATSYRIVQPVHREQLVRVTFLGAAGTPSRGGRVAAWRVGEHVSGAPVVEPVSSGVVRLRGVPFVPGALLRMRCERETDDPAEVEVVPVPAETSLSDLDSPLRWRIPDSPDEAIDARFPLTALTDATILDATIFDHSETDNDQPDEASRPRDREPEVGTVRVEVRLRDGPTTQGIDVSIGRISRLTESNGTAILDRVPVGHRVVTVSEAGLVFESPTVFVAANVETRVMIHEIEGGTIELEVVDAAGRPTPFARVGLRPSAGPPWTDLDGAGEQRLDPFTDVRGRRTCARIAPGTVAVTARYGDGQAKADVELKNGERRALRLELR